MLLQNSKVYLAQGDSITDWARNESASGLGNGGYVSMLAELLPKSVKIINRGISGNRIVDLEQRWTSDTIALKPDVISIMIGINDAWHTFSHNKPTSADSFAEGYQRILSRIKTELPDTKIILMQPFYTDYPHAPDYERFSFAPYFKQLRADLNEKIERVNALAQKYADAYLRLDEIFSSVARYVRLYELAADAVHPSALGHKIIADALLKL